MTVAEVEELIRLVDAANSPAPPRDVAANAIAALHLLRRFEADMSSRRDDAICALHRSGESLQRLHERTGLSRARLHQIIQAAQ